jgi:hypothetical protein
MWVFRQRSRLTDTLTRLANGHRIKALGDHRELSQMCWVSNVAHVAAFATS